MGKRILRVSRWIGMVPAVAVCAACAREFTVPVSMLKRVAEAQQYLTQQFDAHECAGAQSR